MQRRIVFALAVTCFGFITTTFAADEKLAFHADGSGNLIFNTGVVKGALQKDGPGEGIKQIQFIGENSPFDINHGLLVPYRFLTPQKRFGFGSWEWPRTGQIRDDGSAELSWGNANDRPFHFSQTYRWKSADTLDVTVKFTAETDLEKFELFLGSYFTNSIFSKAKAYVKDAGNGRPGFIEAIKQRGYIQLFPKNSEALSIVNDGRWKFPPYPMDWRIRGALQAPLGMKQDPKTGATVIFMSPLQDCFALSIWQQEAPQGAFYLSLFGRDIARGQTATSHVRLIFGKNISDAEAVQRYTTYLEEIKGSIDPAATNHTETVRKTDWISPEIPKPGADGWITLFDGQHLFGCDPKDPKFTSGKVSLKDGYLRMDNTNVQFDWKTHNLALRVRGKKIGGRNIGLSIGPYGGWFNGQHVCFGIRQLIKNQDLAIKRAPGFKDFFEMEMKVIDGKITLLADGGPVLTTQTDAIQGDVSLSVGAVEGISIFKKIEAKVLDASQ